MPKGKDKPDAEARTPFARFEALVKRVIVVPKAVIDERRDESGKPS